MDRIYDRTIINKAAIWLLTHYEQSVGSALLRYADLRQYPLSDGRLHIVIALRSREDWLVLRRATTSPIEGSDTMPGPLDRAFEYALPGGPWPVLHFEIRSIERAG